MARLAWDNRYSIGIKAFALRPATLFDTLYSLREALVGGQGSTATDPLLRQLLDAMRAHFAVEEDMLAAASYPGLQAHSMQNRKLIDKVEQYLARIDRGEFCLSLHLVNFLRDWLTHHTHLIERDLSTWLLDRSNESPHYPSKESCDGNSRGAGFGSEANS
jgi:hemerythrin